MRKQLDKILLQYIQTFAKKQGLDYEFSVGNDLMDVASFGSTFYFGISEIIYDIDNEVEKGLIIQWMEDSMEHSKDGNFINYRSYVNGLRYGGV